MEKKNDVFRIEKVLRRKTVRGKKTALVRWKGYGPESDTIQKV